MTTATPATGRGTQWKIAVWPNDRPENDEIEARSGDHDLMRRCVSIWDRLILPSGLSHIRRGADYEDWAEQAVRLESGLRLLPEDTIIAIRGSLSDDPDLEQRTIIDRHGNTMPRSLLEGRAQLGPIGIIRTNDAIGDPYDGKGDEYAINPILSQALNRETAITGSDFRQLEQIMDSMLQRHPRIWVKNIAHPKKGLQSWTREQWARRDDPKPESREQFENWHDDIGGACLQYECGNNLWLVQEHKPMTYETRFMIAMGEDGKIRPITAAGCVEEYTPLQHDPDHTLTYKGIIMDARARRNRTENGTGDRPYTKPENIPAVMKALADQAVHICRQLNKAQRIPAPLFIMDMGIADGQPTLIETNSFSNSGLYACDIDAQTTAVRDCPQPPIPKGVTELTGRKVTDDDL